MRLVGIHRSVVRRVVFCAAAAVLLHVLGGCRQAPADTSPLPTVAPSAGAPPRELTVLATADLRDVEGLSDLVANATGVRLKWVFGSTNDSTEAILTGATPADVAWFANARLLLSHPQGAARVLEQSKVMTSPLAIGVSQSVAQALGWTDPSVAATVSWKTLTQAAAAGQITYALPNPATSNQGYMALMGVAAAAADKGEVLRAADVDRRAIAGFLTGYRIAGDDSSDLGQRFVEQQGHQVNTLITYENALLSLHREGPLREPLVLIYPHEGVATADYPFMLLNASRQDDYRQVSTYLQSAPAQIWLAQNTLRRPVHKDIAMRMENLLPPLKVQGELPFSPDRALSDGLIDAYLNDYRRPLASTLVLDTSSSMKGPRREQLLQALHGLAGDDNSLSGRVSRWTYRERIWVLPFADTPGRLRAFELPALSRTAAQPGAKKIDDAHALQQVLTGFKAYIDSLPMEGGTALYDSVLVALRHMHAERQRRPEHQYSVIALTDGENTRGTLDAFEQAYALLPREVHAIPVFMILFGDANAADLYRLIEVTGGKVFDARTTPLGQVFKDIRAHQ